MVFRIRWVTGPSRVWRVGKISRFLLIPALALSMVSTLAAVGCGPVDAKSIDQPPLQEVLAAVEQSRTVLSKVYTIDRKYRSMMGPFDAVDLWLGAGDGDAAAVSPAVNPTDDPADEIVWITGYRADMVAADGATPMPQEFMCHSNLDIDVPAHQSALDADITFSPRLFTLSQGQLEIDFPAGYGIPVRRSEPLRLTTQVLNLNHEAPDIEVRHRVTVTFVADGDVAGRMKALQPIAAYGLALTAGVSGHYGVEDPDPEVHGPGCLVGESASDHAYEDGLGHVFAGHWQVPPGHQENRTLVTRLMNVPYATEIHYVAVHLHPFATSLELRDLTDAKTLFRAEASQFGDKVGLATVDHFASPEGVAVYPDHEYELFSVYDNTSDEMQDSMAVMYIYLRDRRVEERLSELRGEGS